MNLRPQRSIAKAAGGQRGQKEPRCPHDDCKRVNEHSFIYFPQNMYVITRDYYCSAINMQITLG